MYSVIIAGGYGTRLWPLSDLNRPKPLIKVDGDKTLLDLTLERLRSISKSDEIYLVITKEIAEPLINSLPKSFNKKNIIIEPCGRNTAACMALAAHHINQIDPDGVIGFFPADHLIPDVTYFKECANQAEQLALDSKQFVLLGLKPDHPSTEYGYIEIKGPYNQKSGNIPVFLAKKFTEKPDKNNAQKLIEQNALWNSGMYIAKAKVFLNELRTHLHDVYEGIRLNFQNEKSLATAYANLPNISIDYAVTQKLASFIALETKIERVDIGNFDSLYDLWAKDPHGNSKHGLIFNLEASNNLLYSSTKPVAVLGVNNLVVIEGENGILVCAKDKLHLLKEMHTTYKPLSNGAIKKHEH